MNALWRAGPVSDRIGDWIKFNLFVECRPRNGISFASISVLYSVESVLSNEDRHSRWSSHYRLDAQNRSTLKSCLNVLPFAFCANSRTSFRVPSILRLITSPVKRDKNLASISGGDMSQCVCTWHCENQSFRSGQIRFLFHSDRTASEISVWFERDVISFCKMNLNLNLNLKPRIEDRGSTRKSRFLDYRQCNLEVFEIISFALIHQIAQMIFIPPTIMFHRLKKLLHFVLKRLHSVHHRLSDLQKQARVIVSKDLLKLLKLI
jgi:hypothetical protein